MRRSAKARRIDPLSWVFGIVLLGGALVAFFSMKPTDMQPQDWPMGIGPDEVQAYAAVLDRRPVEVGHTLPVVYDLMGSEASDRCLFQDRSPGWRTLWLSTDGYADSVRIRSLNDRPGYLLKFPKRALLNGKRRVLLVPATVRSMRAKYMEVIARRLGLLTPEITFLHVTSCGSEPRVYRKEERVDKDFLKRHGLGNASLVEQSMDPTRPDLQFVEVDGDSTEQAQLRGTIERAMAEVERGNTDALAKLVDQDAAVAWLVLAWLDGRDLHQDQLVLAHQWSTGRMLPIHRPAAQEELATEQSAPLAYNLLTPLLTRAEFRSKLEERVAALKAEFPELRIQFDALDRSWLPVLADQNALPFAQTAARQEHEALLDDAWNSAEVVAYFERPLFAGPGHASLLAGVSMPPALAPTMEEALDLDAIAKRYKLFADGDTLYFPRGKYMIEEDLVLPKGVSVVLLQGARLFLGPRVNMVCQGGLWIRGTLRNPVFIRPIDDQQGFGVVAVRGDGSTQCRINGLMISGGSGGTIEGVRYDGMVSVHGAVLTEVHASIFQDHTAAVSLLVDGGGVGVENTRIMASNGAGVRVMNGQGSIMDCTFTGPGKGLWAHASRLALVGGSCTGLGTGVEADAGSEVLVHRVRFERNGTALDVREASTLHADGSSFKGNELVIRASTARSGNGSRIALYTNEFLENTKDREVEDGSRVEQQDTLDPETLRTFGMDAPSVQRTASRNGRSRRSN
jgi:hypothetical protein